MTVDDGGIAPAPREWKHAFGPWTDVPCAACGTMITETDAFYAKADGIPIQHADCPTPPAPAAGKLILPPEIFVGDGTDPDRAVAVDAIKRLLTCDLYRDGSDDDRNGKPYWDNVATADGDIHTAGDLLHWILYGRVPEAAPPVFDADTYVDEFDDYDPDYDDHGYTVPPIPTSHSHPISARRGGVMYPSEFAPGGFVAPPGAWGVGEFSVPDIPRGPIAIADIEPIVTGPGLAPGALERMRAEWEATGTFTVGCPDWEAAVASGATVITSRDGEPIGLQWDGSV
jgi:hypothetical protein